MSEETELKRTYTAEQKFKIVKEALTTDRGVSGVCRKYGISTGLFYKWQEKFLAGAREGLERKVSDAPSSREQRTIAAQAQQIAKMQHVIAEITAENVTFKKSFGEL